MTHDVLSTAPATYHSTPGERFVRAFYVAWNAGGWQAVEPLIDEQFDDHASPPTRRVGRTGFCAARQASAQNLRDVHITVNAVFSWTHSNAQEHLQEFVLAFVDIDATFAGPLPLRGTPPTGNPITISAWSVFRLERRAGLGLPEDRILVEHWELQNLHAVWQAIGGPAMVRTPAAVTAASSCILLPAAPPTGVPRGQ